VQRSVPPAATPADPAPVPGRVRSRLHTRLRRAVFGVLLLLVVALSVFGYTAVRVWQVAREDHRGKVDAIVVLGASQFDGRPSPVFQARLTHAKKLHDAGVAPLVMTLGGKAVGDRFTEGDAGARWLADNGVPAKAIKAVGVGRNTIASLEAAVPELEDAGVESVVIVTDPWHSLRSRTIAEDLGFDAATSPTRTGPVVRSRATQFRYILRETGGYLAYRIFGDVPHRKIPGAA
jgi:uncharacterized SAM-binding protein YcdF (DUF218 family)